MTRTVMLCAAALTLGAAPLPEVAQRGRHFDPHMVDAFLGVIGEVARIQRELGDQVAGHAPEP